MVRRITAKRYGFTIVELMVAAAVSLVLVLGLSLLMADAHRGWNQLYDRVNEGRVADAYVVRKAFDAVVRQSTVQHYSIDSDGQWVEVYYYSNPQTSTEYDSFARFYESDDNLMVDYGSLEAGTWNTQGVSRSEVFAENVISVEFSVSGPTVKMVLELGEGDDTMTVVSSAVRHNP